MFVFQDLKALLEDLKKNNNIMVVPHIYNYIYNFSAHFEKS